MARCSSVSVTELAGIVCVVSAITITAESCVVASQAFVRFPGGPAELRSPNGNYAVYNIDSETPPHHVLEIRNLASSQIEESFSYSR